MLKAVCDICGRDITLQTNNEFNIVTFRISSDGVIWDLCKECQNELLDWIECKKLKYKEENK